MSALSYSKPCSSFVLGCLQNFSRSTTDQLLRLETFIREGFIQKQHVTAIFFDLEKAYDTTWQYGIVKDLHDAGLRGRHIIDFSFRLQLTVMQQYIHTYI